MDNDLEVSRRNFIAAAVGAGLALSVLPGSLAAVDVPNLTKADLDKWMTQVSNAGRWGKDDQKGTINLITPAKLPRLNGKRPPLWSAKVWQSRWLMT